MSNNCSIDLILTQQSEDSFILEVKDENSIKLVINEEAKNELEVYVSVLTGPQGPPGQDGQGFVEKFEAISKNLKSWDYVLNYTSEKLTSIVYTEGALTVTKTLNYTGDNLTSIVLSGAVPSGINLTKTLTYTSGVLTSIDYS